MTDIGDAFGGAFEIERSETIVAEEIINGETRTVTMAREPRLDHTACIVISERSLDDPIDAFITLAHEIGHYVEQAKTKGRNITIGGRTYYGVVPATERTSSLYGAKMAQLIYTRLGGVGAESAFKHGARSAVIYNRVMAIF